MLALRGSTWGPPPLPELIVAQLEVRGLTAGDASRCAAAITGAGADAGAGAHFVDLGACKFLEGDLDGAIAAWRHGITSADDAVAARALLNLGLLYEHVHLFDRALVVLQSVREREIEAFTTLAAMAIARCQQAMGSADDAMETMARLAEVTMARRPDATTLGETLLGLGIVAHGAGRFDRAERAWRAAAAGPESPARRAAVELLVELLELIGHEDEVLELSADQTPESAGVDVARHVLDRADRLSRLGHGDRAADLVAGIEGSDLGANDRFRLAEVRLQLGLVNEAIDELEVLLSAADPTVRQRAGYVLGEVYRSYEMSEAAMSMYERVVDGADRYWAPRAALILGDLLAATGQDDAARRAWGQATRSPVAATSSAATRRLNGDEPAESPDTSAALARGHDRAADGLDHDRDEPAMSTARSAEPIVVLLSSLDVDGVHGLDGVDGLDSVDGVDGVDGSDASIAGGEPLVVDRAAPVEGPAASAGTEESGDEHVEIELPVPAANPYAALAPESHAGEPARPRPNPYAELAPNYEAQPFEPVGDVEPGDWESMLEERRPVDTDAGPTEPSEAQASEDSPRAFSRYT